MISHFVQVCSLVTNCGRMWIIFEGFTENRSLCIIMMADGKVNLNYYKFYVKLYKSS